MKQLPYVEFSKTGWKQLSKLNRHLGSRFIKGVVLRYEISTYIAHRLADGMPLDCGGQELRYEDGVYLILKKVAGTWYVTDTWATEKPTHFSPVLFWTRMKRGCSELAVQVLIGWRSLRNIAASKGHTV